MNDLVATIVASIMVVTMLGLVIGSVAFSIWLYFHPGPTELYEKLKKEGFTDEEIAESYVFPSNMSKKEKAASDKEFSEIIAKRRARQTPEAQAELQAVYEKYKAKNKTNE